MVVKDSFQDKLINIDWNSNFQVINKLFEKQVKKNGDKVALVFGDRQLTYAQLNNMANCVAWALKDANIGLEKIVGVYLRPSFESLISILGVLKAGAAFLPIDIDLPEERVKHMIKVSNTEVVLCSGSDMPTFEWYDGKIINVYKLDFNDDYINLEPNNNPENLAYVLFTSGSTGLPKGVMIEHKSLHNFIQGMCRRIDFSSENTMLFLTTISFDIFILETLLPLIKGMKVVIASENERKNPALLKKLIVSNSIDMIQMTPSRMEMLLVERDRTFLSNLKTIMIGGESFQESLVNTLKQNTNAEVYNMYGPTETTIWSSIDNLTNSNSISLGEAIDNTYFYILNNDNNLVSKGEVGELCISGAGVARGYINEPDKTMEKFALNPFDDASLMYKTGDLVKLNHDNSIEYVGRIDNQVKFRGYRIELEEIEASIKKCDFIKQAVVLVKEDNHNKELCAFIVFKEKYDIAEIKKKLSKTLPGYMIPSIFIEVPEIPLMINGKLNRQWLLDYEIELNKRYEKISEEKHELISEKDNLELNIKRILSNIMNKEHIMMNCDSEESFENLGIDSLNFMKLIVTIESEYNIVFEDENLGYGVFRNIIELARYVNTLIN